LTVIASREIRLKKRLVGAPSADNFELATVSVPAPALGEVQVKNLWMWVDPYMRGRMVDRASYHPRLPLGEATPAREIGEVAASNSTMYGWRPAFRLGEALQGGAIGEPAGRADLLLDVVLIHRQILRQFRYLLSKRFQYMSMGDGTPWW
jgi:N-terminal domain of oxidoreductase